MQAKSQKFTKTETKVKPTQREKRGRGWHKASGEKGGGGGRSAEGSQTAANDRSV